MTKIHNYFDFIVGTVVLIIASLVLYISSNSSGLKSQSGYSVFAKFENAEGINSGSDIKISGVKIGTVASQSLDNSTFQAVIKFYINDNIKIPVDSSAKIVSEGLLGAKYIAITPGGSDENLSENQEINFTQSSVNFEELLGKFIFNGKDKNDNK
jgi:phospholipid/cholesterol/gamma-HCH transport system substrate-binding protein